jgi:hypothetical protein
MGAVVVAGIGLLPGVGVMTAQDNASRTAQANRTGVQRLFRVIWQIPCGNAPAHSGAFPFGEGEKNG